MQESFRSPGNKFTAEIDEALTLYLRYKLFVILAGCLVIFFITRLIYPMWIYNPTGWVDGFAYLGHFLSMQSLRLAMPEASSGDLVALIFPASLLYKLFSPIVANILFKSAGYCLSLTVIFLSIEILFNWQSALLTIVYLSTYKYFLIAMGSDYTDGRVILYFSASIYFLLASENKKQIFLIISGFLYFCAVNVAILALCYLPLLIIISLSGCEVGRDGRGSSNRLQNQLSHYLEKLWKLTLYRAGAYFILGCIFAYIFLMIVHFSYTGSWMFMANSVNKLFQFVQQNRVPAGTSYESCSYLYLPIFILISLPIFLYLTFQKGAELDPGFMGVGVNNVIVVYVTLFSAILGFFFLQLKFHQETITNVYYFNQLMPIIFLGLGSLFYVVIEKLRRAIILAAGLIMLILGLLIFRVTVNNPYIEGVSHHHINSAMIETIYLALLLIMMIFLFKFRFGLLAMLLVSLCVIEMRPWGSTQLSINEFNTVNNREKIFLLTVPWVRLIERMDPSRQALLWYKAGDGLSFMSSFAAASHLWQGRVFNESFPNPHGDIPGSANGGMPIESLKNRKIIVMTEDGSLVEKAQKNLREAGLDFICGEPAQVGAAGSFHFDVYECKAG